MPPETGTPLPIQSRGRHWGFRRGGLALLLLACSFVVRADGDAPKPSESAEGAIATETLPEFTPEERAHWAFQPVVRPSIPEFSGLRPSRNPIDALLLHRLEKNGLSFNPPASKAALIRRATIDLTGIPPTSDEIADFLADDSPDAYERLIDRLLASPHYGEAWGRDWLDLVRFAETAGYNADPLRPLAWKYRDYVIRAFNDDTPYDRFVQEQIAGDELFPGQFDPLVATGYNRMWPDESNASNVLLARQDALNDLTGNVGSVFLGLSLSCAQCHDHKFDPLLQRDFYSLQAFFAGIVPQDRVLLGLPEQLAEYEQNRQEWLAETAAVRKELHSIGQAARAAAGDEKRKKFPPIVLESIDTAPESRTALQHQLVFWSERQVMFSDKEFLAQLTDTQKQQRAELQTQLKELTKRRPRPPAEADIMAAVDIPGEQPKTHLLAGGSYNRPKDELPPGFLAILGQVGTDSASQATVATHEVRPSDAATTHQRRSILAHWLTDPANPLVPRVLVNRLWQGHFAHGLVENANDFGTQTPPPHQPELLDWLASEFVARGWSIKGMHKLIMTSEVYRQAAYHRQAGEPEPKGAQVDPDNHLYWHFPRRRLTAERIRDAMLAVSGKFNSRMEGPGVRVPLPSALGKRDSWKVTDDTAEHGRRSVYIFAKRNLPHPLLQAFDLPDMHESCPRRAETTIAPQALFLLNSDDALDYANAFAGRLKRDQSPRLANRGLTEDGANRTAVIEHAYLLAFGRTPDESEITEAAAFLDAQSKTSDAPSALADFCHALLNSNEFLFLE